MTPLGQPRLSSSASARSTLTALPIATSRSGSVAAAADTALPVQCPPACPAAASAQPCPGRRARAFRRTMSDADASGTRGHSSARRTAPGPQAAVIFGAGGAVGTALAREFASQGAAVFVSGRQLAGIEALAAEIQHAGGSAQAAQVDA